MPEKRVAGFPLLMGSRYRLSRFASCSAVLVGVAYQNFVLEVVVLSHPDEIGHGVKAQTARPGL